MTAVAVEAPIVVSQTRVIDSRPLGESFVRLVVAGPDLLRWSADVVDPGTVRDAYIKVIVPPPGGGGAIPDADAIRDWLALPEAERGWMRTYTVRRADTVELDGEHVPALTVDMVVHPGGDEGPGSAWARSVRPGAQAAPSVSCAPVTRPPRRRCWRSPRNWPGNSPRNGPQLAR